MKLHRRYRQLTRLTESAPYGGPRILSGCLCCQTLASLSLDATRHISHPNHDLHRTFSLHCTIDRLEFSQALQHTGQHSLLRSCLEIPELDGLIITRSSKALIVRTEGNTSNGFSMAVPHDQVVHVWLEILDYARLVGGNQVRTVVGELKGANRSVVRLEKRMFHKF